MLLQDNTSIIDNELSCATPPTYHPSPLTQHTLQQPSQQRHRVRSASSSHAYITTPPSLHSAGIRKKRSITAASRHRSISTSYGDRLHHLALEQSAEADFQALQHQHQASLNWLTPQHSPEPSCFFEQEPVVLEQYQWAAPTPPRSDSGIPSVTADFVDECRQPSCSEVDSPEIFAFDHSTAVADMSSSLGFLLPQQYANGSYSSEESASYTQPTTSAPVSAPHYGQTVSSSPSLYQSRPVAARRHTSDLPTPGLLPQIYPGEETRRIAGPYDSPANSDYSMPQTQTIPSISSMPLGSPMSSPVPAASVMAPHYGNMAGSPSMYDSSQYYSGATPYTSAPGTSQMYAQAPSPAYPRSTYPSSSSMEASRSTEQPTRANGAQRQAQCFDHGCNGRFFSTFSNLLRHQRERSGTATKSSCPRCGAEFTRTTARNGHMAHDKCTRVRRSSEDGRRDPDTLAV